MHEERPVPRAMGMQVTHGNRTEMPSQGILREDLNSDRPASGGVVLLVLSGYARY